MLPIHVERIEIEDCKIRFYTDLPEGTFPFRRKAILELKVVRGTGESYVKKFFPGVPYIFSRKRSLNDTKEAI